MKSDNKIHVSVVVIGHVDSGKSTTTGHLVYRCGGVDKRTIDKFEKEASEIGRASFRYAWVLDKTGQERSRGITIDCTVVNIQTEAVSCTLIDAPGHRDFMKNMITGTAHADYAIFMVPASTGEFETAIGSQGQLKQQAMLAYAMGIRNGLVFVNKMDAVAYAEDRFKEIVAEVADRLKRIGFKEGAVAYMPGSGLAGDGIMEISTNTPWFKGWEYTYTAQDKSEKKISGKCLYDFINTLCLPPRADKKPLRGTINDVFKIGGVGTVAVGRIDSGKMKPGDIIYIAPANVTTEVKSIEMHHKPLLEALPGDNMGFNLKNVAVNEVRRGCVFGLANDNPPREVESFQAHIMAIDKIGDNRGIRQGYTPIMDIHTSHIPVKVSKVISVAEKKKKKKEAEDEPAGGEESQFLAIKKDDNGIVELIPQKPVCLEPFTEYPSLGRFSIRDSQLTVAVGVVKSVVKKEEKIKAAGGAGAQKSKGKK